MKGNLIVGAGGHGKVIADMMLRQGMKILGFLDDNPSIVGQRVLSFPILGKIERWMDFDADGLVVAVGDNVSRRTIVQKMESEAAPRWVTLLHPSATVAESVRVGIGTVIIAGAVINAETILGKHTIVNTGATVDHDCLIGDFAHVAPGSHLAGGVHVGAGALIGIGSCVTPGCRIGDESIIGAGAAVVRDVPPGVIARGVPARWRKRD